MNSVQTAFTIFFAICWGTAANAQPRWKAFNIPLFKLKRTKCRILISVGILNLAPMIYFGLVLKAEACLPIAMGAWTWLAVAQVVLFGIFPSFAAFAFYRFWISAIESSPAKFYYGSGRELPAEYRTRKRSITLIEPTLDILGLRPHPSGNFIGGIAYFLIGILPLAIYKIILFAQVAFHCFQS